MTPLASYVVLALGSLLAVLNPFATIPPFVAMTDGNSIAERHAMARRACYIAAGVLSTFALTGLHVLNFFGVSVPAFQIAGGLVLVGVAFELLQGKQGQKVATVEQEEGKKKEDISVTPLAIPILCGPATITAGILVSSEARTWYDLLVLVGVIWVIYSGIYVLLRFTSDHSHRLGDTAIMVSSRMMGLILVAVAVQFVIDGIRGAELF